MRADEPNGVIYLGSFSKTFAPGLRVGFAVAPHGVREKLVLAAEASVLCPSAYSQLTVSTYLATQPWFDQVKRSASSTGSAATPCSSRLAAHMPAGTTWTQPAGGFYSWVTLPDGLDAGAMLPRAVTARVAYVPGHRLLLRVGQDLTRGPVVAAAVLLLSRAGPHPRGRPPARRRRRGGARADHDLRTVSTDSGRIRAWRPRCSAAGTLRHPRTGPRMSIQADQPLSVHADADSGHALPGPVAVLAGGLSHERDVSVRSGRRVAEALRTAGAEVRVLDVDAALLADAARRPTGRRVPAAARSGRRGRGRARRPRAARHPLRRGPSRRLPGRLRQAGGQDRPGERRASGSRRASPSRTRPSVSSAPRRPRRHRRAARAAARGQTLPRRVSPRASASSGTPTTCRRPWSAAFAYGDTALVERFVDGTEVAVSVVERAGPVALPAVEIVPDGGFYDYAARYTAGATEFFVPARLDAMRSRPPCAEVAAARARGARSA